MITVETSLIAHLTELALGRLHYINEEDILDGRVSSTVLAAVVKSPDWQWRDDVAAWVRKDRAPE